MSSTKQGSDIDGEEEQDFFNVDTVLLLDEDFRDIIAIESLSHTASDKINFTVFSVNTMLTGFLAGNIPQHFYLWHTLKFFLLLPYRWYAYKKVNWHYYLFDFCYFVNAITVLFLWLPFDTSAFFPMLYILGHGPLLWAVVIWRNSFVPHSVDKMTSLFLHLSPAFTTWGIRWYTTSEQGFIRCADVVDGVCVCTATWKELIIWPLIFYAVWQLTYILVVEIWSGMTIRQNRCSTSYTCIVEGARKGFLYRSLNSFPPILRKPMFILSQVLFTMLCVLPAYFSFFSFRFSIAIVLGVMVVACYNGATFYVDVFGRKYYGEHKHKNK